jgi:hypothetical protein
MRPERKGAPMRIAAFEPVDPGGAGAWRLLTSAARDLG